MATVRDHLEAAARAWMQSMVEKYNEGMEQMSLDEFLVEYHDVLEEDEFEEGRSMLSLFYEYGGAF